MARGAVVLGSVVTAATLLAGCDSEEATRAEGSGSSFARLAFDAWCEESELCTYRPVGSGTGIDEMIAQDNEFAASDVPLTPDELQDVVAGSGDVAPDGAGVVQLPALAGAVTLTTNISGIDYDAGRPRFTAATIAKIFSGRITTWDAPEIAAENPGLALPDSEIALCVREDSSGTSAVFTQFLAGVDPGFADTVGASKRPDWPASADVVERPRNGGVIDCVRDRDNAIGYADLGDVVTQLGDGRPPDEINQLAEVGVERDGRVEWVAPTIASITLAGAVDVPGGTPLTEFGERLLDSGTPGAYPITATTFILLRERYSDPAACATVVGTARWAFSAKGQQSLADSYYAPISPEIRARALAEVGAVTDADGAACGEDGPPE
jgi:phosphate transport system substrate-binding protein